MQSVIDPHTPTFYDWHDEARIIRASRDSLSRRARAVFSAARRAPDRPFLGWCEARADGLSTIAFLAILMFYAAVAAYLLAEHLQERVEGSNNSRTPLLPDGPPPAPGQGTRAGVGLPGKRAATRRARSRCASSARTS